MAGQLVERQVADCWLPVRGADGALDQAICVLDAELRVVSCDRRFLELLDYPAELGEPGRLVAELTQDGIGHEPGSDGSAALIAGRAPSTRASRRRRGGSVATAGSSSCAAGGCRTAA